MIRILKYSFSRSYFCYSEILGIKRNVFLYPSIVIGFLLAFNVLTILSLILMIFGIGFISILYPFVGIGVILTTILYIGIGSHYKIILKDVEIYGSEKRSKLNLYSVIYALISIFLFIWVYRLYYQDLV